MIIYVIEAVEYLCNFKYNFKSNQYSFILQNNILVIHIDLIIAISKVDRIDLYLFLFFAYSIVYMRTMRT